MNTGYLLTAALGAVWTAIAIIVSEGRHRDCPTPQFYFTGSLFAVLILTGLTGPDDLRIVFAAESRIAVCCFFVGSLFNGEFQNNLVGHIIGLVVAVALIACMVYMLFFKKYKEATKLKKI